MTGIDRSTVADTIRRLYEKGLIARERTEKDGRTNAVTLTAAGRKELRMARNAAERVERLLLEPLPATERARFIKYLEMIAQAGESMTGPGAAKFRRRMSRRA
jgi:DNA-binding MarR family transcriptional regulator